ncbi:hypothetical protein AB0F81_20420 [Actinoplanes sp. NPDC024001]|uniref:hypothetical protein n=1 Tax=Actinoplanes sp. NPDC024001 TaxID=3154598 RepID=UPI0033F0D642
MADGFTADLHQIRAHADRIDAAQHQLATIRAASAAITEDHAAYGRLCAWISGVLEHRHVRQGELLAYVEENLRLAADTLISTGQAYASADGAAADRIRRAGQI